MPSDGPAARAAAGPVETADDGYRDGSCLVMPPVTAEGKA
jgi:hypothetical protein